MSYTQILYPKLTDLLADGAQLAEVLPTAEYDELHLAGAISIPLKTLDAHTTADLDRSKAVVVYCWDGLCDRCRQLRRRGPRPRQARRRLRLHGQLDYHPIVATRADTNEVLHVRMRNGRANTQRGALRFVDELIARVRKAQPEPPAHDSTAAPAAGAAASCPQPALAAPGRASRRRAANINRNDDSDDLNWHTLATHAEAAQRASRTVDRG